MTHSIDCKIEFSTPQKGRQGCVRKGSLGFTAPGLIRTAMAEGT